MYIKFFFSNFFLYILIFLLLLYLCNRNSWAGLVYFFKCYFFICYIFVLLLYLQNRNTLAGLVHFFNFYSLFFLIFQCSHSMQEKLINWSWWFFCDYKIINFSNLAMHMWEKLIIWTINHDHAFSFSHLNIPFILLGNEKVHLY